MRNFLQAFLLFLLWATFALVLTNNSQTDDTNVIEENNPILETKKEVKRNKQIKENLPPKQTTSIKSATKKKDKVTKDLITNFIFQDKFITNADHTRVLFPKSFFYFKDSMFNFINHNPDREIIITGNHLPNETLSNASNYGIQRALYLKNKLVKHGVNPMKINIKSIEKNYAYDNEGYYADGILISHQRINVEKRKLIDTKISSTTLYPIYIKNKVSPNNVILSFTIEAVDYLRRNPSKKILITGYTRNTGDESRNYAQGLEDAKSFALFLESNGVPTAQINTFSKGALSPVAAKTNKPSKTKNRRLEILIQ